MQSEREKQLEQAVDRLKDGQQDERYAAPTLLKSGGGYAAVQALIADPDSQIRQAAAEALGALGERDWSSLKDCSNLCLILMRLRLDRPVMKMLNGLRFR